MPPSRFPDRDTPLRTPSGSTPTTSSDLLQSVIWRVRAAGQAQELHVRYTIHTTIDNQKLGLGFLAAPPSVSQMSAWARHWLPGRVAGWLGLRARGGWSRSAASRAVGICMISTGSKKEEKVVLYDQHRVKKEKKKKKKKKKKKRKRVVRAYSFSESISRMFVSQMARKERVEPTGNSAQRMVRVQ
ncbi:hypothetical protein PABG_07085 [Paracoccidioides brasiliensis Pb03]|nr:hypothetical protein PABG_07085 [Paracoccidioides brasiliensis Pb03]